MKTAPIVDCWYVLKDIQKGFQSVFVDGAGVVVDNYIGKGAVSSSSHLPSDHKPPVDFFWSLLPLSVFLLTTAMLNWSTVVV